jgi:hypothetical protein
LGKFITFNKFILILFVFFFCETSNSQTTGSILIKCTILAPLNVTSTRDLDFGTSILPGIMKTVDKSSVSSGKVSVSGVASKQINISFSLPSYISYSSNQMPISFNTSDGGYKTTSGTLQTFNPISGTNASLGTDGKLDIFIGGKVSPYHNQVSGAYTGTITVNLQYTGN